MPIIEFPAYIEELAKNSYCLFKQNRGTQQSKRFLTGFEIANKHSIAYLNRIFMYHMKK